MLHKEFKVLDHGFIKIIDLMGDDLAIVDAARISYNSNNGNRRPPSRLIDYLMRNSHTSPFEMAEIKLHIKLPIFVIRQWMRHRTGHFNEKSGRYAQLEDVFYIPEVEDLRTQCTVNRQARSDHTGHLEVGKIIRDEIFANSHACYELYTEILQAGCAREIARMVLPTNIYTEMFWKVDLSNFMKFIVLRYHESAQYEMQQYAKVLLDILEEWCPCTYESFMRYKMPIEDTEVTEDIEDIAASEDTEDIKDLEDIEDIEDTPATPTT